MSFKKMVRLVMLGTIIYLPLVHAESPVGRWVTVDDKTGDKRAEIQLTEEDGQLSGTIVRCYPKPGDTGVCSSCPGDFKGKPIQGLRFIWGLTHDGKGTWDHGELLDPTTGHIYHVKMTRVGKELHVRGYLGFSLIGRSQTWLHAEG